VGNWQVLASGAAWPHTAPGSCQPWTSKSEGIGVWTALMRVSWIAPTYAARGGPSRTDTHYQEMAGKARETEGETGKATTAAAAA